MVFVTDTLDDIRQKVAGTNIDQRSLLSTDYFNTFNSVVMVLDMLAEAPELLEEIEQWTFCDYVGHFRGSGLDFADLAIEAYAHAPVELRTAFERKIGSMRIILEDCAKTLRRLYDIGDMEAFATFARAVCELFHGLIAEGNAIVHGGSMSQTDIDAMF